MNYCEQCGAANDLDDTACTRCGAPLSLEAAPLGTLAAAGTQRQSPGPTLHQRLEPMDVALSADLKLPEWLKAAAAETPHDPDAETTDTGVFPPTGFVLQTTTAAPSDGPDALAEQAAVADTTQAAPERHGAGQQPIPDWMRAGGRRQAHTTMSTELSDTSSFITENDLPEWIRQIADADAAKRAEEQRLAAEVTPVTAAEATVVQLVPLPGEAPSGGQANNRWLNRRENVSAGDVWTGRSTRDAADQAPPVAKALADPAESPTSQPTPATAGVQAGTSKQRGRFSLPARNSNSAQPSKSATKQPELVESQRALPSSKAGNRQAMLRIVLIGTIVLLLLVVVAMTVL